MYVAAGLPGSDQGLRPEQLTSVPERQPSKMEKEDLWEGPVSALACGKRISEGS